MSETTAQQEERVYRHLIEAKQRIEQDIIHTSDRALKRIEADAATVVTLSMINELLPEKIQNEVRDIISLHESVWNQDDTPPHGNTTPRRPLGERLIQRFAFWQHPDHEKGEIRHGAHDPQQSVRL